ncbi:poly(rC)-binding protein 3-like [Rhopalosiphum padi]|uniref:poly(rC)-binding protein 3-like n=1 Tax=Rhopalosiphum padi TaxID=40932 RepID=UPI00298DEE42|nr:poly(rC)-binding protein 3-like [Rhopalosiphum padi]
MSAAVKIGNHRQSRPVRRPSHNGRDDVELTMRILFNGREVGSVIGKGGETIKNIRNLSGARVIISNASTPERIVLINGNRVTICKATELIGQKVDEFFERQNSEWNGPKSPLTLKLIVPASQCGFIIGKGGNKIKEIRESSGAAILVASEMLSNSTERLVSITGTTSTISHCVYLICNVLIDSPPRIASIPYHPCSVNSGLATSTVNKDYGKEHNIPFTNIATLGLGTSSTEGINQAALAALAGSQLRTANRQNQNVSGEHKKQNAKSNIETISMTVPNDLIGCVIGKRGSKIADIRQISGAIVHIFKFEGNNESKEIVDRRINITGNKKSISVAKYLIEMSVELQKANLEDIKSPSSPDNGSSSTASTPTVAPQLFAKPDSINTISSLYAYIALSSGAKQSSPVQTTGVHRPKNSLKRKRSPSGERINAERTKFAHY